MSLENTKSPQNKYGGEDVMEAVKELSGRVFDVEEIVKEHIKSDYENMKIMTNTMTKMSVAVEFISKSLEKQEKSNEATKELILAIRDESKDRDHELQMKIMDAEHSAEKADMQQDLNIKSKNSGLFDKYKYWVITLIGSTVFGYLFHLATSVPK